LGSPKSFIKINVHDQIKLPKIAKQSLVIKTFGNYEIDRVETCDNAQVTVGDIGGHFSTRMEALCCAWYLSANF
jgi:hypothetical protein